LHPYQLRYWQYNAIATITAIKALINQYENIVLIAGGIKNQEDYNALFALIDNRDPLYAVFQAFKGFDGCHH
jgi:UDP-N-acetylmuramoylalanine-D-glutamate ligase